MEMQPGHGVWAPGPRAPWSLATDLADPRVDRVALDDRRLTSEAPCRKTTGCCFGVRLAWTPCRTPHSLARLRLLVGVALVRWTAVGYAVAERTPSVRLRGNRKGPRLSLVRVGMRYLLPLAYQAVLNAGFIQQHLPRRSCGASRGFKRRRSPQESDQRSGLTRH